VTYTATTMVNADGSINGPIVIADDYLHPSRSFQWTIPAISGFSIGGCTCFFGGVYKDSAFLVQGSVIDATGGNWYLRFELYQADTIELEPGRYRYSVEVRHLNRETTRVLSDCSVQFVTKPTADGEFIYSVIDGGFPESVMTGDTYDGGTP